MVTQPHIGVSIATDLTLLVVLSSIGQLGTNPGQLVIKPLPLVTEPLMLVTKPPLLGTKPPLLVIKPHLLVIKPPLLVIKPPILVIKPGKNLAITTQEVVNLQLSGTSQIEKGTAKTVQSVLV